MSEISEQEYLEDNIATVAFHLGQPGAKISVRSDKDALTVDPGEVLKEISRRLSVRAQPSPRCDVCGSGDTMTICEGCWTRQPLQRPLAYRLDHPAMGIELSISEPDKDWAARGWTVTPLAASPAQSSWQSSNRAAVIEECAQAAEAQKKDFLSPEYASNQPFGSLCERFACDEVAKAIRALALTSTQEKSPCSHAAIIGLDGTWHCQKCGAAIDLAVAHTSTPRNTAAE